VHRNISICLEISPSNMTEMSLVCRCSCTDCDPGGGVVSVAKEAGSET